MSSFFRADARGAGHDATIDSFREALTEALFTEEGILDASGADGMASVVTGDPVSLFGGVTGNGAREVLVRLFLAGRPCGVRAVERALPSVSLDGLQAMGIVEKQADVVSPRVRLLAYAGMIVASSSEDVQDGGVPADYVMGVGMSSIMLADLTIRRPVGRTLDLGCGSGVQGLLAARHSERVVAIDSNPRATFFTQLNARLNRADNLGCVQGDFLDPIRESAFDLITCNPPFVISPDTTYIYRDSGLGGDTVCRRLVETAPRHLREGGYCQVLCHWAHVAGQAWQERVAEWCAGTGCDAWAMQAEVWDPESYVGAWVATTEQGSLEDISRTRARWLASMEEQRIEAIGTGLITLRRRSAAGSSWLRVDDGPDAITGPAGEQVLRVFTAQDFLDAHRDDRRLLSARLRVAPEARFEEVSAPGEGAWRVMGGGLRLSSGLCYSTQVDPDVAQLVGMCDGKRAVASVLADFVDDDADITGALTAVRLLVERGFVVPVEG